MFDVIIAAGGQSTRMGGGKNKLLMQTRGKTVLEGAVLPFLEVDGLNKIIIALPQNLMDDASPLFSHLDCVNIVCGGTSRTRTVKAALAYVTAPYVLVHDGARPYVTPDIIARVLDGAQKHGAAVPVIPVEDTVAFTADGFEPVSRASFSAVQTPQGFDSAALKKAYSKLTADYTDDSSVYKLYAGEVSTVEGAKYNKKITTFEDLSECLSLCGAGYDIHTFKSGNSLKLGGAEIPFDNGVTAHSDGDVLLHALMDAILAAVGARDIGYYFPNSDKEYKNADSAQLLKQVLQIARERGFEPCNMTAEIIAERPKIAPYISEIRASLSKLLDLPASKIGISATTNEKVGDIGNGQAIAALCYVYMKSLTVKNLG